MHVTTLITTAIAFCLALVAANPALAQVDRATVSGTVRDSSSAVVDGVTVTVTYPATGLSRPVFSNARGAYFVTGLPVGPVVVLVERDGFRPIRVDTELKVGETRTLDFSLEVAGVEATVEVVAQAALARNTAEVGATFGKQQIGQIPLNGRNWGNLMALVPGAVDSGAGNGSSVRFFGHNGDDNNFRIDGVDATSVRNQSQSKSRLLISTDAIAEFRVSTALYGAESGGAPGVLIEIVSKGGANDAHGSAFEYFRNSALDSRSPFDGAKVPEFDLNQFGGTVGGPIRRDRTFFFASYEGLNQRQGRTQIGFVPSAAFRASVSPALKSILDAYPEGQTAVNASVSQWTGVAFATQKEHVGLVRFDHRMTDTLSAYVRVSTNSTDIFTPSAALPVGTQNLDAPTSGLIDLLYLAGSRTTNELRIGANYAEPINLKAAGGTKIAIAVPGFSTLPADTFRIATGITQSLTDQWATLRGSHAFKAGVDMRRVQLIIHDGPNAQAGTLSYASLVDFQNNRLNTAEYSSELPTKQMRKLQYFGYVQDEWRMRPTLTANLGMRYEYYGVFRETQGRAIPFDINLCGGYCPAGSAFHYPDRDNVAPRVSLAWAPSAFHNRTVVTAGAGIYYGDAQLGNAYSPANNDTQRFTLSQATTPGLSYPIDALLNPNLALATAPRSMPLDKENEMFRQFGVNVQHALSDRATLVVGYQGQQGRKVFSRTYVNVIDPSTGRRPLPSLDQIDVRGSDGLASFHGLTTTLSVNSWRGLFVSGNYMLSHAMDDENGNGAQNLSCKSCEWADSSIDARHVFSSNFAYQVPFARDNPFIGGWQVSGVATARTGLPINVTVTRRAVDMPDGNVLSPQRPNLVPGAPLYLDYGTTGRYLNIAAFQVPAPGTWGDLPRNALRAPGLFQVDMALSKRVSFSGSTGLEFGLQVFNALNRSQLAAPASNISSAANFGRITSLVNSSPVGVGTPRQMQLMMRMSF